MTGDQRPGPTSLTARTLKKQLRPTTDASTLAQSQASARPSKHVTKGVTGATAATGGERLSQRAGVGKGGGAGSWGVGAPAEKQAGSGKCDQARERSSVDSWVREQ